MTYSYNNLVSLSSIIDKQYITKIYQGITSNYDHGYQTMFMTYKLITDSRILNCTYYITEN